MNPVRYHLIISDSDCSCCGWKTGATKDGAALPHYYNELTDTHHCTICHTPGHNWSRPGDSEDAPTD